MTLKLILEFMHRNINKIETVADISDEDISANQSQLYKSSDSSSVMRRNYVNLTDTTSVVIVFVSFWGFLKWQNPSACHVNEQHVAAKTPYNQWLRPKVKAVGRSR